MARALEKLSIRGFKSIKDLEGFELKAVNVLIGANGAGKSNFVDFFRMLRALSNQGFQRWILDEGGQDRILYNGAKATSEISAKMEFGQNSYRFKMVPTSDDRILLEDEFVGYCNAPGDTRVSKEVLESALNNRKDERGVRGPYGPAHYVYETISNWTVYHFHDTTRLSPLRKESNLHDWELLRGDGSNLASILMTYKEKHPETYALIRNTIQGIAPFFDDFLFRPRSKGDSEKLALEWRQKGSDLPMQPGQFSDGTLRFIALATALLQPDPPATVLIDEPELGLHPQAIALLAEMVHTAASRTQIILSTQSPGLVNHFEPDDIITVNRVGGASTFDRLSEGELSSWLDAYCLGDLWLKNVVQGGPRHEEG